MPELDFPRVCGEPVVAAQFNAEPEHFRVTEIPLLSLTGEGDHYYLRIRKHNLNTHSVVKSLARQLGLKPVDIGYAGRKDKWAVTEQWFSIHAPKHELAQIQSVNDSGFEILEITKHTKKLRTGELQGNHFAIQLSEMQGDVGDIYKRAEVLLKTGWPNYFGLQRFGKNGQNLIRGERMLTGELRVKDRNQRSMYLSACRSYLFNEVLAARVLAGNWHAKIDGDVLDDTGTVCGQLMGDGDSLATAEALAIEQGVIAQHQKLFKGIQNTRMAWQTRPLVIHPDNFNVSAYGTGLLLEFSLPKGAYATTILRELIQS